MSYGTAHAFNNWLQRNLGPKGPAQGPHTLGTASIPAPRHAMDGLRLRVLRPMLAVAALALMAIWYQEANHGLLNVVDRALYPVLLAVNGLGALLLSLRPRTLRPVVAAVFVTFITYLVSNYYHVYVQQVLAGSASTYELSTLALWLPLGYVAGYVFFSPRVAGLSALAIYAAFSLPQLVMLGMGFTPAGDIRELAVNLLLSHPVYLAALWGVAQLKTHAMGAQDLAQSMSAAATEDPLTGVANRRAMVHALEAVVQGLPGSGREAALLLFDVDRFKAINDSHGHHVGDDVLIALARHAQVGLRSSDLLGRWGGEEFVILALDQGESQAMQMAERLRAGLEQLAHPGVGPVTASVGVTLFVPGDGVAEFLKRADDALYLAKERGRNRVEALFANAGSAA